jgi:hypothetical protein
MRDAVRVKANNNKYKFNCYECNNTFTKNISTITNMNIWFPYCNNTDCEYCYERSFASFKGMCCRAKNGE